MLTLNGKIFTTSKTKLFDWIPEYQESTAKMVADEGKSVELDVICRGSKSIVSKPEKVVFVWESILSVPEMTVSRTESILSATKKT